MSRLTTAYLRKQREKRQKSRRKKLENVNFLDATQARASLATLSDVLGEQVSKDAGEAWVGLGGTKERPQLVIEAATIYDLPAPGITVTIQEARARWSDLLDAALHHGRDIWITRRNKQVLVIYRDPEAILPCQDLLDRDDSDKSDDGPGGGTLSSQIAELGGKIDEIGRRLDEGIRSFAGALDSTVGPVRRLLTAEARKREGLHPTIAMH